jgi:putative flippase GtrA
MLQPPSLLKTASRAAAALALALCFLPSAAVAQTREAAQAQAVDEVAGRPFIDRHVESAVSRFWGWKARMKSEHFSRYLIGYTIAVGALAGAFFGFLAFRFGDAMAPYLRIRRKTLQLAVAIGAGLGVLLTVTEAPPHLPGKLTMLLLAMFSSTVAVVAATMAIFVLQRRLMVWRARRSGFPLSGRLRVP